MEQRDRLQALRNAMQAENIQAMIIPTSDYHDTEYVSPYFEYRKYFSGFTGSAGTLVVLMDKAALWTDGRYFIQARKELEGSGIDLMKMGLPGTPSIAGWIIENLKAGDTVAFDGRTVSFRDYEDWKRVFAEHDLKIVFANTLIDKVWTDRPALPDSKTFYYDEKYSGRSVADKLAALREQIKEDGANSHLITKIDEIAWLYNMRADDIPCYPVALAYTLITPEGGVLYIDEDRLDGTTRSVLEDNQIRIAPYDAVYEEISDVKGPVLAEPDFVNAALVNQIQDPVFGVDPVVLMKAMKNETEQQGERDAHLKDGAAVIRFWKWLEEAMAKGEDVTEISAAEKLHEFRAEQPDFLEESFTTISAYGPNAAMAHYHPDEAHPVPLENKGLYLVDSGGQYLQGTTDITRTFVMGDLTEEEKEAFTRVLQGHIRLASAIFPHGVRGLNLDILARGELWKNGQDYNHGTGHGVGHLSNVHEAPNGIRWKIVPERNDSAILEIGMVTSDEPGMYEEGKYGIRHENLLMVQPYKSTDYGDFYCNEVLTLVPFDVRGLDLDMMGRDEKAWLNDYHKTVYEKISPLLNEEEKIWLKEKTAPVKE